MVCAKSAITIYATIRGHRRIRKQDGKLYCPAPQKQIRGILVENRGVKSRNPKKMSLNVSKLMCYNNHNS